MNNLAKLQIEPFINVLKAFIAELNVDFAYLADEPTSVALHK
jgi:hypothetical protein